MARDMSFLPEDYLEKRIARRTNVICMTLFVVVLGGVIAAFFVTNRQWSQAKDQKAEVDGRVAEAARKLEQLEELQAKDEQWRRKAMVSRVLVERVPRSRLLAEIINNMPMSMGLLELQLETQKVRTTRRPRTSLEKAKENKRQKLAEEEGEVEVPISEVSLALVGVAPTDLEVSQFMTKLNSHPLFDNVALVYSEQTSIEDHDLRKFEIEMALNQDVNLEQIEPTLVRRGLDKDPMDDTLVIEADKQLPNNSQKPEVKPVSSDGASQ